MTINVIQQSFASGELSPALSSRTDLAKYRSGAAMMRNFFVDYRGGASSRAGTRYICTAGNSSHPVRLIPFQFSTTQSYVLEFGHLYMRVIKNGAQVVSGMSPYQITTPYTGADLAMLKFTQSADTMTLCHPSYQPRELTRTSDTSWTLTVIKFVPQTTIPTMGTVTAVVGSASTTYRYVVTAIDNTTGEESLPAFPGEVTTAATMSENANESITITWVPVANASLYNIYRQMEVPGGAPPFASLYGLVGSSNGGSFIDHNVLPNFAIPPPQANSPFSQGQITSITVTAGGTAYGADTVVALTTPDGVGFLGFPIIAAGVITSVVVTDPGYGYTAATGVSFVDPSSAGSGATGTVVITNPNRHPTCVAYFEQRLVLAATPQLPETFWMSQPGRFTNFSSSTPSRDSDAIQGTVASVQVNAIKALVPVPTGLLALTSGSTFLISGGSPSFGGAAAPVTPTDITAVPQASNGCHDQPAPIAVNRSILYVQAKGALVRELDYKIYFNVYDGADITWPSTHLFDQRSITEWAYSWERFKTLWAVRDDGVLLSLAYIKEQELAGWAWHDTNGLFQSVATVAEGSTDAVYFVVQRIIGGTGYRFIERLDDRFLGANPELNIVSQIEDAWCVDAGVALPQPTPAATLYPGVGAFISGQTGVGFITDNSVFVSGDVGKVIRGSSGKALITAYVSGTRVNCTVLNPFPCYPNDPLAIPIYITSGNWTMTSPTGTVTGLSHLETMQVVALADGNPFYGLTVSGGAITLPNSIEASSIIVGLAYTSQLQTMPLDVGEPTIQGKRKKLNAVTVRMKDTYGVSVGRTFTTLVPLPFPASPFHSLENNELFTGDLRRTLDQVFETQGQLCVQVTSPLPATILGVIPEIALGDTNAPMPREKQEAA